MRQVAGDAKALPSGVVTFLFTDIEGSTRMLQRLGDTVYTSVLDAHRTILRNAFLANDGVPVATDGDGFFVAFSSASRAVAGAVDAQRALARHPWDTDVVPRVRMGLHTGPATPRDGDYAALAVNRAARVAATAHGGQILVSSETRAAVDEPPPQIGFEPLGRHRLKDLTAPIELFQVTHEDLDRSFPPIRSLEHHAHNLPVQVSSFIGRELERIALAETLREARAVTLTGPGGVGKTRLAYQVAADTLDAYPDGVWVAQLASVRDPDRIWPSMLRAVALVEQPGQGAEQKLLDHFRGRTALVMLDNCEHLIDAAAAAAKSLLQTCPDLRLLATSREPLRIPGEVLVPLSGLVIGPEGGARTDATALFVSRASDVKADLVIAEDDEDVVRKICTRLDGSPLAIELAASWMRSLSVGALWERLEHSLDLLVKGTRGADRRRSSLRGTIDWSHDLLSERERVLFRRLAVFDDGWGLEAAESVCGYGQLQPSEVLLLLDGLVDRSLAESSDGVGGARRYRFLETIHAYASERVEEAGESTEMRERHAEWFLSAAKAGDRKMPFAEEASVYDRFDEDHANFLEAIDHFHEMQDDRELDLVIAMGGFWHDRTHWMVGLRLLRRALDTHPNPGLRRMRALVRLGHIEGVRGDLVEARSAFQEAMDLANIFDPTWIISIRQSLGTVAFNEGNFDESREHYERCLEFARANNEPTMSIRGNLARVALHTGNTLAAKEHFEAARVEAAERGDRRAEGIWSINLGVVENTLGNLRAAKDHNEQALAIAREVGRREAEGRALINLGELAVSMGDLRLARQHLLEAQAIAEEVGDQLAVAAVLGNLAALHETEGDPKQAIRLFRRSLGVARERGEQVSMAISMGNLGRLLAASGDLDAAREHLGEALEICERIGDRDDACMTRCFQATVALDAGDLAGARNVLIRAVAEARELNPFHIRLAVLLASATLLSRCDDHATARKLLTTWRDAHRERERCIVPADHQRVRVIEHAAASVGGGDADVLTERPLDMDAALAVAARALEAHAG